VVVLETSTVFAAPGRPRAATLRGSEEREQNNHSEDLDLKSMDRLELEIEAQKQILRKFNRGVVALQVSEGDEFTGNLTGVQVLEVLGRPGVESGHNIATVEISI
jgi:hypothetical protein